MFLDTGQQGPGIRALGSKDANILIVPDCPGVHGLKAYRAMAGPEASVLEQCLHQAGLTYGDVYVYPLFFDAGKKTEICKGSGLNLKLKKDPSPYLAYLHTLVGEMQPKVIVPLGEAACLALTGQPKISVVRGYAFKYEHTKHPCWIIPSLSPREMIWTNYIARFYVSHDLMKARRYAEGSATPVQVMIHIPQTVSESLDMLSRMVDVQQVCFDIEVTNHITACIGFQTEKISQPCVINYEDASKEDELRLWRATAKVLENPNSVKIGQNLIFDIHFLAHTHGIFVKGPIQDTMIMHSLMYPDFLKGLGFLASIYTDLPYWKGMVKFKSIKKED